MTEAADEFSQRLLPSDLREFMMRDVESGCIYLRYDILYSLNKRGKLRQVSFDGLVQDPEERFVIREVALDSLQREFIREKRIRANLRALPAPREFK